jgi:hypothetical protein
MRDVPALFRVKELERLEILAKLEKKEEVLLNMKTLATLWQNKCMNMRSRIETVFDVLKERYGLVTSLPRSVDGYIAHYIRYLFAYLVLN